MATHPNFPNLEVTTTPVEGKFYQPKGGDSINLIAGKVYPGLDMPSKRRIIASSAYNKRTFKYAMTASNYNCTHTVDPETPNSAPVLCGSTWPPMWIPQASSKAEPESYAPVYTPGGGAAPGGGTTGGGADLHYKTASEIADEADTKKKWKTVGAVIMLVSAAGLLWWIMSRRQARQVRLPARGLGRQRSINDEDRRQWIENDEGLYNWQRSSRQSMREFIKNNRKEIDEVIENVTSGKKRQHYLVYG